MDSQDNNRYYIVRATKENPQSFIPAGIQTGRAELIKMLNDVLDGDANQNIDTWEIHKMSAE